MKEESQENIIRFTIGNNTYCYHSNVGERLYLVKYKNSNNYWCDLEYDDQGRLILKTDSYSNEKSYKYDEDGNLCEIDSEDEFYEYDDQGNVSYYRDDNADSEEWYEYDAQENLIYYKYWSTIAGYEYWYKYNASNQLIYQKGIGEDDETHFEYDINGNLLFTTNKLGDKICYEYDDCGNLLSKLDKSKNGTRYEYDERNNLIHKHVIGDEEREYWYTYDIQDNLIYYKVRSSYIFDHQKKYREEEYWYEYNEQGNIIYTKDSRGIETWIEYEVRKVN